LNLGKNDITDLTELIKALPDCCRLKTLDLTGNPLTISTLKNFIYALPGFFSFLQIEIDIKEECFRNYQYYKNLILRDINYSLVYLKHSSSKLKKLPNELFGLVFKMLYNSKQNKLDVVLASIKIFQSKQEGLHTIQVLNHIDNNLSLKVQTRLQTKQFKRNQKLRMFEKQMFKYNLLFLDTKGMKFVLEEEEEEDYN